MKLFRRGLLLPLVLLLGGFVAACVTSGPQKALNDVADALSKNDGTAFLARHGGEHIVDQVALSGKPGVHGRGAGNREPVGKWSKARG